MAVVYMRKLEQEPETYDSKFTSLTKGVNLGVQDWILDKIKNSESILEIGCGTGILAAKIALKGNNVVAIDKNFQMIDYAMKNYPVGKDLELIYQIGSYNNLQRKDLKDKVVSTFMLSELRPFEQQIFLRNVWKTLKPEGKLIIAAEFVPSGFWKLIFKIKRWRYKKKLKKLRLKSTVLIKWFLNYLEPIGFQISDQKEWKHGSIRALELKKITKDNQNDPGYYQPKLKKFKGIISQLRIFRCLLTGQIDHVPIEPGIYQAGHPNKNSPIIVTANYEYTYIKLMRALKNIDAWVLCVDSNGINVWCAARGNHFGNNQLLEAIEATNPQNYTGIGTLLLPQLSAGGISLPELPLNSEKFPFKVKFGPIWAKSLPKYLKESPVKKPDEMKLARFTISHRIRAGITHTTFLFRKIFILPILSLLMLFLGLSYFTDFDKLWWIGELVLWILIPNLMIFLLFPLSKFTRKFISKGIFFGFASIVFLGTLSWLIHNSILYTLTNLSFFFWISFFSTMSFSGYTMATSPREIQNEYSRFKKYNNIFLILSLVTITIGIIFI